MNYKIIFFFFLFAIKLFSQGKLYPVVENGTLRFINYDGKTVKGPYPVDEIRIYDGYNGEEGVSAIAPIEKFVHYLKNGKTGVMDLEGNELFPAEYDTIRSVSGSKKIMAEVKQNKKWGLLTRELKWIAKPIYDQIYPVGYLDSLVYINVMKDSLWGLLDANGKEMVPCLYDEMVDDFHSDKLWLVTKNGKKGLSDNNGNLVFPCEYDAVGLFHDGYSDLKKGDRYFLIHESGKKTELLNCASFPEIFYGGLVKLEKSDGKEYLMDVSGKIIAGPCDQVFDSQAGMCLVKNKKQGFVSFDRKMVVPPIYTSVNASLYDFSINRTLPVQQGKLFGAYDSTSKLVVPIIYEEVKSSPIGFEFKKMGKWGVMDTKGNIIAPALYDAISYTDSSCYVYVKNKKSGLVGYKSKKVIQPIYDQITFSSIDDVYIVTSKNKHGLVDSYGKILWPLEYESIGLYNGYLYRSSPMYLVGGDGAGAKLSSGLPKDAFYVSRQGKIGILNLKGETIIPIEYDDIGEFYAGVTMAKKNGVAMIINKFNKEIKPLDSEPKDELFICDSLVKVKRGNKWGLVDQSGKWLIKPIYDSLLDFDNDGRTICVLNGKNGIISASGKVIVPPVSPYVIGYYNDFGIITHDHKIVAYLDSTGRTVWRAFSKVKSLEPEEAGSESICFHEEIEYLEIKSTEVNHSCHLPDCIYNLKNLRSLKVFKCSFDTTINPAFGNLKQLKCLQLNSSADKYTTLGKELEKLSSLDTLITSGPIQISSTIESLPSIKVVSTTSDYLPKFPSLQKLHYSFYGDSLSPNLLYSKDLKDLDLFVMGDKEIGFDQMTERRIFKPFDWDVYFSGLSEFTALQNLRIDRYYNTYGDNQSAGTDILHHFPSAFYKLKNLRKLDLIVPGIDSISSSIANWSNLHYLNIRTGQDTLPAEISKLSLLDTLILGSYSRFPNFSFQLPNLKFLECLGCNFPSMPKLSFLNYNGDSLPAKIIDSKIIDSLYFSLSYSNNDSLGIAYFTNTILQASKLGSLRVLDITIYNMRSDIVAPLIALAPAMSKMPKLTLFKVRGDKLSEEEKSSLKKAFSDVNVNFLYQGSEW